MSEIAFRHFNQSVKFQFIFMHLPEAHTACNQITFLFLINKFKIERGEPYVWNTKRTNKKIYFIIKIWHSQPYGPYKFELGQSFHSNEFESRVPILFIINMVFLFIVFLEKKKKVKVI